MEHIASAPSFWWHSGLIRLRLELIRPIAMLAALTPLIACFADCDMDS